MKFANEKKNLNIPDIIKKNENLGGIKTIAKEFKLTLKQKISKYLDIEAPTVIFFTLWFVLQILIFVFAFVNYSYGGEFVTSRQTLGMSFLIARATSLPIEINTAMVMLPMCRTIISFLRSTPLSHIIPFDKNKTFHKLIGWCILGFSLTHSFSHYVNFYKLGKTKGSKGFWGLNFATGTGMTGNLMLLSLITLVFTSNKKIRHSNFELFWYTHHLFALFFFLYSFHGGFCLVPKDIPPYCAGASFYKYWTLSGILYLYERLMREFRGRKSTHISRVVLHPSKVVEIQFKKEDFEMKAGQYIFLCCPEVSLHQWHPFTLTSAPEDDYVSVHIRVSGDFTHNFAIALGCNFDKNADITYEELDRPLPSIMIDGPFGAASEDVFNYEVSVLIGAGIGVTPFASILRSIWYRLYTPSKETRLCKAFEWFQNLLSIVEQEDTSHVIEINTFLTGRLQRDEIRNLTLNFEVGKEDALTGLRSQTSYGRPNWDAIFSGIKEAHKSTDIGVFFCGPKSLNKILKQTCNDHTQPGDDGTKFHYNKGIPKFI